MTDDLRGTVARDFAETAPCRHGDKVLVRWETLTSQWLPGRVVKTSEYRGGQHVKVALSLPNAIEERNGLRIVPEGTPIYERFRRCDVYLLEHDKNWNPFTVEPFMNPDKYRVLGGDPAWRMPGIPGLTHVGAYISGDSYDSDDFVWIWENGWRRAQVIEVKHSWVSVRYIGFRHPRGHRAMSYHPPHVWPVLCDFPTPVRDILVEPEWAARPSRRPSS